MNDRYNNLIRCMSDNRLFLVVDLAAIAQSS